MTKIIEYIYNFFQFILDFFRSIGNLLSSLVRILGICVNYLRNVLSILPTWMYVIVAVLVIVCVLYKILGREGNS